MNHCAGWISAHQMVNAPDVTGDERSDFMHFAHQLAKQNLGVIPLFRIVNDDENAREFVANTTMGIIPYLRVRYRVIVHPDCVHCRGVECAKAGPCNGCGRRFCEHAEDAK